MRGGRPTPRRARGGRPGPGDGHRGRPPHGHAHRLLQHPDDPGRRHPPSIGTTYRRPTRWPVPPSWPGSSSWPTGCVVEELWAVPGRRRERTGVPAGLRCGPSVWPARPCGGPPPRALTWPLILVLYALIVGPPARIRVPRMVKRGHRERDTAPVLEAPVWGMVLIRPVSRLPQARRHVKITRARGQGFPVAEQGSASSRQDPGPTGR